MKKTLIVLVAALAALGIILFKQGSDRKAMQADVPALDSALRNEARTLKLAKKPDTAVLVLGATGWQVKRDSFPADTGKVSRALGHIFGLKSKEKVSESAARLSEYGLDSVEAKHVSVYDGAGKPLVEVLIGKGSGVDFSSTYWKWKDKPEVYRTPGNFSYEVGSKEEEWKERRLFAFTPKDLKFLEVSWKDTAGAAYAYKLEALNDSTWKMLQPVDSNRVVKALVTDAASRFCELGIDEFIPPTDTNAAKAEKDSTTLWVKGTLKDGKAYEMSIGKARDNFYYPKHPTRGERVKLSTWRFDNLRKKPFELLEAPPAPKDTTAAGQAEDAAKAAAAPAQGGHGPGDGHGH